MLSQDLSIDLIRLAIAEDIGDGDHSSLACIPLNAKGKAKLLVKENGILAGISVAQKVAELISADLKLEICLTDGEEINPGDIAFCLSGPELQILQSERLILNFMQRMSGIATFTNRLVKMVSHTSVTLLDTRKTTPGLRWFEKEAVRIGGGQNHRFGLYDMVMLKDNHIDFAGGIEKAIQLTNSYLQTKGKDLKIEVEVRNFEELETVLRTGNIHRIMLDNFSPKSIRKAINIIDKRYETEASGGINESNLESYAETGVDYISIGAFTHQIKSLDLSLKAVVG